MPEPERMKEHGIIFSTSMVPLIISGDKWQTRRVIVPQLPVVPFLLDAYDGGPQWNFWTADHKVCNDLPIWRCPYGRPGDKLWVRETWAKHPDGDGIIYRATDPGWDAEKTGVRWKSSRFMPRWASRILLEVTGVRVQRVQEISWQDIRSEGVTCPDHDFRSGFCASECGSLRRAFAELWDSINAKRGYGWEKNPWCWCLSFKRIDNAS